MKEIAEAELVHISGGSGDYPYLEVQVAVLVGVSFIAGAVGSPAVLGGACVVGALLVLQDLV
jgi:hypothetical protein